MPVNSVMPISLGRATGEKITRRKELREKVLGG